MKQTFAKVSPFQVDPSSIEKAFNLNPADFEPATQAERESVVEKHKSISYWRDAWRRFRKNTVSMVALFVFLICLIFAFVCPSLIPYNYSDQYRGSQKLAPYLLADSDLDRRMKDALDGLTWAHTETINVDSARLNGALDLGEHYYICDISSIATTFETGKGEVESVSNMRVIVRERNEDVRAIALELY